MLEIYQKEPFWIGGSHKIVTEQNHQHLIVSKVFFLTWL